MRSPWIQGDSILALTVNRDTLVIRLSDVTKLEKRKFNWIPIVVGWVVATGLVQVLFCDDNLRSDSCF